MIKKIQSLMIASFLFLIGVGGLAFSPIILGDDGHLGPTKSYFKIDSIEVEGIKKVEAEAIYEILTSKVGDVLDNYILRQDIIRIYALKYFDSVEAHQKKVGKKNILVFKLKERPIITKITISGNDEIDEDDLKSQIEIKEFSILDINTINRDVRELQKFYEGKGYYLASIEHRIKKINAENIELEFHIKEFDKVRVKQITFLGNSAFSDDELKGIMETREEFLFSFMNDAGNFKEFNFQVDIEKLKYFYQTKGFLQINVAAPEITISEDKKWVFITLKVNEGPEFSINSLNFKGSLLFDEKKLNDSIILKSGDIYSEEKLRRDIIRLTELYQDKGYAFANVSRNLRLVPGENKVDVDFSFEKGNKVYFGSISIKGNTKTRDKVIRRELKIREGALFSGRDLRISKENVNRPGFFEPGSVIFNTVTPDDKDDVLDVVIEVKERDTGQIQLGVGYSTSTAFFFQGSIAQTNFLGKGQNLTLSIQNSKKSQNYNLGFTEPYFYDTKWTAGGDIFHRDDEQSEFYHFKRSGFDLRVGHPIFDYTKLFLTYKWIDTDIRADKDPTINKDVENGITSSIKASLIIDKRNNSFEPSSGFFVRFGSEVAGVSVLGGQKKWVKNELDTSFYHRVYGDLVFRSRLFAGKLSKVDDEPIARTEKFMLGGPKNLRGYPNEAIGPFGTDKLENGKLVSFNKGSYFSAFTTLELEHPMVREAGLKWVLFVDYGDAQELNNFRGYLDYGFGFRWFSPIGILRFEWGFPVDAGDRDAGGQFHFDIGQLF